MKKLLLSLALLTPILAQGLQSINLSETKNLNVKVGEKFIVNALAQGPIRNCYDPREWEHETILWRVEAHEQLEMLNHTQTSYHDGLCEHINQCWTFRATQSGTYELEFNKPYPSPMQAMSIERITINVE